MHPNPYMTHLIFPKIATLNPLGREFHILFYSLEKAAILVSDWKTGFKMYSSVQTC
jgi:hypothetical protein